jgi:hypothetical protein
MPLPEIPNHLLVKIDRKYQDEIVTEGGHKLFVDTRFRPEWHATINGRVVEAPERLSLPQPWKGLAPEVEVGDEVYFSYLVLFDRQHRDNFEDVFFESPFPDVFTTFYEKKKD